MNEQEIIEYLKQNKEKGTSFNFMPEDVRLWCITHKDESIFNVYYSDGWNIIRSGINCYYAGIYALPDDYKLKPEFKPNWEEFEIDCSGTFVEKSSNNFKRAYHWWNWTEFLTHNHEKYDDFGGWVYETPLSNGEKIEVLTTSPHVFERGKDLSAFIILNGKNESKPAYPTKILFWRYKE